MESKCKILRYVRYNNAKQPVQEVTELRNTIANTRLIKRAAKKSTKQHIMSKFPSFTNTKNQARAHCEARRVHGRTQSSQHPNGVTVAKTELVVTTALLTPQRAQTAAVPASQNFQVSTMAKLEEAAERDPTIATLLAAAKKDPTGLLLAVEKDPTIAKSLAAVLYRRWPKIGPLEQN